MMESLLCHPDNQSDFYLPFCVTTVYRCGHVVVTAQCICPGFVTDAARAMQGSIHRLMDADLVLEQLRKAKDVACMVTIKKNAVASPVRCGP